MIIMIVKKNNIFVNQLLHMIKYRYKNYTTNGNILLIKKIIKMIKQIFQ